MKKICPYCDGEYYEAHMFGHVLECGKPKKHRKKHRKDEIFEKFIEFIGHEVHSSYRHFSPSFGRGLVEKANRKVFDDLYYRLPIVYSDLDVDTERDEWDDMDIQDWEIADDMIDALCGLVDYPLLSDDVYSEMEQELKDAAWDDTYRQEFENALESKFHIDLRLCGGDPIDLFGHELIQEVGVYFEIDDEDAYLDVDSLVEELAFSTVIEYLEECMLVCKHCLGADGPDECESPGFRAEIVKFKALATTEVMLQFGIPSYGGPDRRVKAIPLSSGLVINIASGGGAFNITHVGSGQVVVSVTLTTLDEAMEIGKKMLAIADWSRGTESLRDDTEVKDAITQIRWELASARGLPGAARVARLAKHADEMIQWPLSSMNKASTRALRARARYLAGQ